MATRQSVEDLITRAKQKMDQAREQLDEANRNGYAVDDNYIEAQHELEQLAYDLHKLMNFSNHQQRDELHRMHLQVSRTLNDMMLDEIDAEQHY